MQIRILSTLTLFLSFIGCSSSESTNPSGTDTSTSSESSTFTGSGGAGGESASTSSQSTTSDTSSSGSGGDDCSTASGGSGGSINTDDPCASLTEADAPEARVVWVTEGDPHIDITYDVEYLWAFQYAVRIPLEFQDQYSLQHTRCQTPAGESESCDIIDIPLPTEDDCAAGFAPKFGIDPSQYNIGLNTYSFTMSLMQGCSTVSQDSFVIEVNYAPE